MTEKITVMQVIYGLKYGGAEKLLVPLARHLDPTRYRVIIVALTCAGPVEEELKQIGADVRVLRRDGKFNLLDLLRLAKLMKTENVKIVHTHLFNADIWAGIVARFLGIKHISTVHGIEFKPVEIFKQMLRMRLPDKIIAVSNATARVCVERLKAKKEKVVVIYNGVDCDRFQTGVDVRTKRRELGIKDETVLLGTFGRIGIEKGHKYLIEATANIKKNFADIVVLIIGEGEIKHKLLEEVSRLGMEKEIRFLGERGDIPELLSIIDIVVFPSLHEGLSLAALEAMAAGRPVVATSVGGIPELIADREDGILVAPKNSAYLAQSILQLVENRSFAERLAFRAKEKVKRDFTEDKMLAKTVNLYEEILH